MHEVNNPLEALTNLVYLTQNDPADPEWARRNMEIAEPTPPIGRNHLVANLLIFHNVVTMSKALERLAAEPFDAELIASSSPYQTEHLNRFGRYAIDNPHSRRRSVTAGSRYRALIGWRVRRAAWRRDAVTSSNHLFLRW
jgi:hypothetical protein